MQHEHSKDSKQVHHPYWDWALLLYIIIFVLVVRVRLLGVPLERDEGEYAYAGRLILEGIYPYDQIYNMKMPGIYGAYAVILAIFGKSHYGIHLGLLVINIATIILIFLLAKRLFGSVTGVATGAAFGLLSLGQPVQGVFANAEHFVILPALGGILLLLGAIQSQRYWKLLAGAILLGLCFLMKQHGIAFIAFGGLYLFFCELRRRPFVFKAFIAKGALFLLGVSLPFAVTCRILWSGGMFDRFWFWTFDYARQYISIVSLDAGLAALKYQMADMFSSAVLLWIVAGFGVTCLCWHKKARHHGLFVVGFVLFSFLAVCPGLYFRPHYFILFVPAVALLAGIAIGSVYDLRYRSVRAKKAIPAVFALVILIHGAYQQRHFFFKMTPTVASYSTYGYGHCPFPESLEIAQFIREHSGKDDRIAVIGSEPQILFYADRYSATGYVYVYPLVEPHPYALKMQQEMVSEIEAARPRFLVFVNTEGSWMPHPNAEEMIFDWFHLYQQENYRRVGIVDLISPGNTVYRWGRESVGYAPQSKLWIGIYQRND